jgi:hypothetical protein
MIVMIDLINLMIYSRNYAAYDAALAPSELWNPAVPLPGGTTCTGTSLAGSS